MKKTNYQEVLKEIESLIKDVPYLIANFSNISALLKERLDEINWVGFYLIKENKLILGPFQGKVACIEIPVGKGVCGTSVQLNKAIVVSDVSKFPGHIACDSNSKSEIVIPIHKGKEVYGVLDIDSPILNRFNQEDEEGLSKVVTIIEEMINKHLED